MSLRSKRSYGQPARCGAVGLILLATLAGAGVVGSAPATDSYDKLNVTATRGPAGAVYLMVVNRSPVAGDAITAQVVVQGFTGNGTAEVRQVAPASYTAYNDDAAPTSVTMAASTRSVGTGGFTATFPPHSVTLYRLPPA
ncbi:hypothetical protein [Phytohabitans kaempferiae]|uniref:Alpha-L-arabinofuranosidase C-terminal domain-containing protein n=1 Tax=Phytohabitans kaempferiae TaxID=1620943 RepID=A0ABV6MBB9_9ACTN